MKTNALNWFELYVDDFDRAKAFYETVLSTTLEVVDKDGAKMGLFQYDEKDGVGGCLSSGDCGKPGRGGTMVYLNVDGELDEVVARIPDAGGKVHLERLAIPPHGFIGMFEDTEGNHVGLHSLS